MAQILATIFLSAIIIGLGRMIYDVQIAKSKRTVKDQIYEY